MPSATATVDHDEIRDWVESRSGFPPRVKRSGGGNDPGILRIDYPGFSGADTLERINWNEWFDAFDANSLAFLYQPGGRSRFSKLVDRSSGDTAANKPSTSRKRPSSKRSSTSKKSSAKKSSAKKSSRKSSSKKRSSSAKKSSAKKSGARRGGSTKSKTVRSKVVALERRLDREVQHVGTQIRRRITKTLGGSKRRS